MGWVENASPEVDAQSQKQTIVAVCITLSALSIMTVSSRLWIRYKARGLGADDYAAALSMVFALIYSILCIAQTKYGLGLPIALRPAQDKVAYTRVNFAGRPVYQLGISFFKVSLLISYLQLLHATTEKVYRNVVFLAIVMISLAHIGCTLSLIFACSPVHKSWDPYAAGKCLPPGPSFKAYAIVSIVSDLIVTLLFIPFLMKLNVNKRRKIGLYTVFLLGLFTTVCSVLRYLQINRVAYQDGNSTMLVLWGTIEFNVGNVVSSLPFLAPVVVRKAKEYNEYRSNVSQGPWDQNSHHFRSFSQSNTRSADLVRDYAGREYMFAEHEKPSASITKTTSYSIDGEKS